MKRKKKPYLDRLPRRAPLTREQVLQCHFVEVKGEDETRCSEPAEVEDFFFQDDHNPGGHQCFVAYLCPEHWKMMHPRERMPRKRKR